MYYVLQIFPKKTFIKLESLQLSLVFLNYLKMDKFGNYFKSNQIDESFLSFVSSSISWMFHRNLIKCEEAPPVILSQYQDHLIIKQSLSTLFEYQVLLLNNFIHDPY